MTTDFDITRLAVTNPAIADATAVEPRQILLDGKSAGTVSLIVWGAGTRRQYDIVVEAGVSALQQQLQALFPGEDIKVDSNEDAVILSGRVSSTAVMLKAGEIAKASASKAKVLNLLQLPGANGSQQVMLQVRFAEVNRNALQELGVSFFTGANGYRTSLPDHHAAVCGTELRHFGHPAVVDVQRLPEPLYFQHETQRGRRHPGAPDQGVLPEPRRTESDRATTGRKPAFWPGASSPSRSSRA